MTPTPYRRVGPDEVRLLRDGAQAFPAMLDAIAGAQHEVLLEMYWVGNDKVGIAFRDALAGAAARGVEVRVLYDALGSIGVGDAFWQPLATYAGRISVFHGLFAGRRGGLETLEQRDHRKVLVVDEVLGFTGGINLGAPWLPREEGGEGWRDDAVAVRGPAVSELRALFFRTWTRVSGERPPAGVRRPARLRANAARGPCVYVLATRWRTCRSVHRAYVERIRGARSTIDLANSYFVPDRMVLRALLRAVRRGVRVRVLVPEKSDVAIVQYAVEASFDVLLRNGVEVFSLPDRMLHSKTAVIDGWFSTIGSYNLDHRSWRRNLELNMAVEDEAFAADVASAFENDLAHARRVDLDLWRARAGPRRAIEWIARQLRRLW